MKKYLLHLSWAVLTVAFLAQPLLSAVPGEISYQGQLTDPNPPYAPVPDTDYSVWFKLYTVESGGTAFWSEQQTVTTKGGLFSARLGSTPGHSLYDSHFSGTDVWLGITVGSDPEITPRTKLTTSPWSFRVGTVDDATGGNILGDVVLGDFTPSATPTAGNVLSVHCGSTWQTWGGMDLYNNGSSNDWSGRIGAGGDEGWPGMFISSNSLDMTATGWLNMTYNDIDVTTQSLMNVTSVMRVKDMPGSWPTTGKGMELAYDADSPMQTGFIQVYDRGAGEWGALYLGNGTVGICQSADWYLPYFPKLYVESQIGEPGIEVTNKAGGVILRCNSNTGGHHTVFAVNSDGRTTCKTLEIQGGSDLSEQFSVGQGQILEKPTPGMLVCIDAASPGRLCVSTTPYDSKVAGIISGAGDVAPGMLMGQKGTIADGEYPIALTGRVYCLVDASFGAIQPGDLLTTSSVAGHAMKATERDRAQGAIIGKAMTALETGRGLVLVLVSLQ